MTYGCSSGFPLFRFWKVAGIYAIFVSAEGDNKLRLSFHEANNAAEDSSVHGGGYAARLRVLLARMIRAEQSYPSGREAGPRSMRKWVSGARGDDSALLQSAKVGVPSDFAQREDGFRMQDFHFADKITATIGDFARERLVVGRRATNGCGNVGIAQAQTIVAAEGRGLACKSGLVQRGEQKIAAAVTGKNAAGAVSSVGRGREAQN